ncbi:MAG: hypothetical protein NWE94_00760 [Candidatus Bathyarchaeota archaeon]|nr:hypothetical protein [Candidatus Bathyarchaeota archaeon]
MESRSKKFHFQEIDWVIYFPRLGNKGKYRDYYVTFRDRKKRVTQSGKRIKLGEVLDKPEIDRGYPHTVGFYKVSDGRGKSFMPQYLELRKIQCVEDLWFFLNSLDI